MAQLNSEERILLEEMHRKQMSTRSIGRRLGRNHTVISRELKRNKDPTGRYVALLASEKTHRRRYGKKKSKLEQYSHLKTYIMNKLSLDHSPEQISGRLKRYECRFMGLTISHETIYRLIYSAEGRREKLFLHLRTKRPHRYLKCSKRKKKYLIPDRISIHERPMTITRKKEFGHWESDLQIFTKQKTCLSVEYERMSQLCRIHKTMNKSAEEKTVAILKSIDTLPLTAWKSITYDNGTENVQHTQLHEQFEIETYFCDGYASWQKGGVENMNKLIRQYFPRYTNLFHITDEAIEEVQEKLNNRPRKSLNYFTPNEFIQQFLPGGAFNT